MFLDALAAYVARPVRTNWCQTREASWRCWAWSAKGGHSAPQEVIATSDSLRGVFA